MKSRLLALMLILGVLLISVFSFSHLAAEKPVELTPGPDPCLMVYPTEPCTYHYDPVENYTVGPGHPLYDPLYDRGGEVLIDINNNEIDYIVYQAPNLEGFVLDENKQGWFFVGNSFTLIVDGWSPAPTTLVNILLLFAPDPTFCVPSILIDGNPVLFDPGLGYYYPIGDLVVSTPTGHGNSYSDTITFDIVWANCFGIEIQAFADENYNLIKEGGECKVAGSHDLTIPVERETWGAIKALYE